MADLITLVEYKAYDSTTPSSDDSLLSTIISACSEAIPLFCQRTFTATDYDVVFDGNGYRTLLLDDFPIISVSRIATGLTSVLSVQNTNTATSRATVRVTSTGLSLYSVASGVETTTAVPFAGNVTVTALAAAVAAVSGWTATVQSNYGTWASADIRAQQGALNAKSPACLVVHTQDIQEFHVDANKGEVDFPCGFTRGFGNWRLQYRAGWETIPEAIKLVCKELVRLTYSARKKDPNLQSESLGIWSYSKAQASLDNLSLTAKTTLNLYRVIRTPRYKPEGGTWH